MDSLHNIFIYAPKIVNVYQTSTLLIFDSISCYLQKIKNKFFLELKKLIAQLQFLLPEMLKQ